MFFAEIKRKYFNIIFLFVFIIGEFWLYFSLKPAARTSYDYYKYNYFKPLNKAEFVYFNLVNDYKKGNTTAYYEPKGEGMWGTYIKKLDNTEKGYFMEVIEKINPSYRNSEKMKDARINLSYSEMEPYLEELEKKLHIYSFYYTGMNAPVYYIKGYGYTSGNSPYWIYRDCTQRFHGKKYKEALKDFQQTYRQGISNGYAYAALDSLGIIIALASQLFNIIFQSGTVTVIIQFVLLFLSSGSLLGRKIDLNLVVRYSYFDDYNFYQKYSGSILANRIIMVLISVILTILTVILFNYRREHGQLINLNGIKKIITNLLPGICKGKTREKKVLVTRSLVYYIFKQSVSKSALLYIPYLCLMYLITLYRKMNVPDIAMAGENLLIFASLFLFIRLGNIEQADGTEGYVFTSNTFYPFIYISRIAAAGIVLFAMVEIPVFFLCCINRVPAGRWCMGVYLSSLFIGMFALLITELSGNYFLGYFSYILYYLFDLTLREDMLLSISGYTYHIQGSKIYLGVAVAVIVIILSVVSYTKQKGISLGRKNGNRN